MKVRELMTSEVDCCGSHTDLAAVAMMMWRDNCGIVPVVEDTRRVVGVVTDRDICMGAATRHRRPEELTARELMSGKVFSVRPEDDVHTALETMRQRKVRRLPVLDADGHIQGLISMNDIVLRVSAGGPRKGTALTAEDVLLALQGICEHPKAAATTPKPQVMEVVRA